MTLTPLDILSRARFVPCPRSDPGLKNAVRRRYRNRVMKRNVRGTIRRGCVGGEGGVGRKGGCETIGNRRKHRNNISKR